MYLYRPYLCVPLSREVFTAIIGQDFNFWGPANFLLFLLIHTFFKPVKCLSMVLDHHCLINPVIIPHAVLLSVQITVDGCGYPMLINVC